MRKESFAHKRGNQLRHFRDIPRRGIVELSFAEAAVSAGAFFFTRQGRPKGPRQPVPPKAKDRRGLWALHPWGLYDSSGWRLCKNADA
jgi:hypothetical protein